MPDIQIPKSSREQLFSDELTAVEIALRKIIPSEMEDKFLAQIPQWFLLLKLFKDMEIAYTCLPNRVRIEHRYRAALTSMMAWSENIWSGLCNHPEIDLSPIKCDKRVVECNVRYLREKYEQWFFNVDPTEAAETLGLIENARAGTA